MEQNTEKARKRSKYSAARYLGKIDIDKIQQAFLCVLKREAGRLLDESYGQKLSEESSKSLVNYLKLLKQFQEQELAALEALTDEELEARSQINHKKGAA